MSTTVNIYVREKTVLWWLATVLLGSLVLQYSNGKIRELWKKIVEINSLNNDISYRLAEDTYWTSTANLHHYKFPNIQVQ